MPKTDDPMPTYGYVRVWTIDQDLSLQRRTLKAAGCDVNRRDFGLVRKILSSKDSPSDGIVLN